MIEAHALTKHFDSFVAVQNITFTVQPGEVLALLGPNGAGKTTTVRMLTSLLRPTSGWARVAGYDIVEEPDQVRASVGVLTENHGLYLRMRGYEYLDFFGELYGLDPVTRSRRARALAARFGLEEALNRRLGEYSKGMRQKLSLVRAMLHNPRVLLLDEPTSAMDPQSTRLVRDMIKHLRGQERTIVLCTHNLAEAEELADRIAIIRRGQIIAQGTPLELKARLLGPPLLEIRLARTIEALPDTIADLVELDSYGHNWLRYRTPDPMTTNPQVLRRLAEHGAAVVTLSEVPQSLEQVYLRVIGSEHDVPAPSQTLTA
ncbi:MAG TPA: ABC transporter ATP-binding protein [Aggregatilineales bacterium]|nr:ABC transporter ATP-binding protein [Chloroflexota bacterium]HOA23749.1 ABC transporter ATP-binding protein [Aggregatilineales bacterium]HPV06301.1 ABC transporter ATP-binding protein [Aggregatilineales bacterium]HQA69580.1 ABC transporter ATP-binding protein [Aggregatilineales bacterium]HQE19596.1 ABC transporter ATP-binding protein [Aggregatilineales bacterium]